MNVCCAFARECQAAHYESVPSVYIHIYINRDNCLERMIVIMMTIVTMKAKDKWDARGKNFNK